MALTAQQQSDYAFITAFLRAHYPGGRAIQGTNVSFAGVKQGAGGGWLAVPRMMPLGAVPSEPAWRAAQTAGNGGAGAAYGLARSLIDELNTTVVPALDALQGQLVTAGAAFEDAPTLATWAAVANAWDRLIQKLSAAFASSLSPQQVAQAAAPPGVIAAPVPTPVVRTAPSTTMYLAYGGVAAVILLGAYFVFTRKG